MGRNRLSWTQNWVKLSSQQSPCVYMCSSACVVPSHQWYKITSAPPTETCKPVSLHFWTACKEIRTHYSHYQTTRIHICTAIACVSMLHHPPLHEPPRARCLPLDTAGQEWELVPRAWCFYCWWCRGISSCRHLFSFHLLHTFQSLQGREKKKTKHNH